MSPEGDVCSGKKYLQTVAEVGTNAERLTHRLKQAKLPQGHSAVKRLCRRLLICFRFQQICDFFLPAGVLSALLAASRQHDRMELLGDLSAHLGVEVPRHIGGHSRKLRVV